MQIYLPIAEIPVDPIIIIMMGAAVGILSGMFGIGGGFLMTPLLIFYGIPPAIAVGTEASHIVGSSVSGAAAHLRRKAVDIQMGWFLVLGGGVGALAGVFIFRFLRAIGQIETVITVAYIFFLGIIGLLMLLESARAIIRAPATGAPKKRTRRNVWMTALPGAMRFRRSQLYISPLPPIILGFIGGLLAAIMGVGGGFIMVPAMIYLLNMPTNVVVGTSLFQIIFVTAITTILHAVANQTVDIVLALLLLTGGVIGAQIGARIGVRLKAEQLRVLLALIVLAVCARLTFDVLTPPTVPFTVEIIS